MTILKTQVLTRRFRNLIPVDSMNTSSFVLAIDFSVLIFALVILVAVGAHLYPRVVT